MAEHPDSKTGWVWKHIPRDTDTDKTSMKRIVLLKLNTFRPNFQRRWIEYQPDQARLAYYKSEEDPVASGIIFIGDMVEVVVTSGSASEDGTRARSGSLSEVGTPRGCACSCPTQFLID